MDLDADFFLFNGEELLLLAKESLLGMGIMGDAAAAGVVAAAVTTTSLLCLQPMMRMIMKE